MTGWSPELPLMTTDCVPVAEIVGTLPVFQLPAVNQDVDDEPLQVSDMLTIPQFTTTAT
jgi:hypothetical protein